MAANRRKARDAHNGHQDGHQDSSSSYHKIKTVEELTRRNIKTVAEVEEAAKAERSGADRIADAIASFCGSMTFVWVHIVWFGFWVVLNVGHAVPRHWHFDPFPFQFLTLVVSLEAIFLSTFILIAQNRQERFADRRSHLDLQINLLSEQEGTKILSMLEAVHKRLGIQDGDPEIHVLEEATRPDKLIEQIEEVIEHRERKEREGRKRPGGGEA